jgi:hypothetical protein
VKELTDEQLEDLSDTLADVRHDLGKYITFEVRFIGLDADTAALRQALKADLLQTDKRGDRVEAAWSVWARLRPGELGDDADVNAIDAALTALRALNLDVLDREGLLAAAATAKDIQARSVALFRRCQAELDERDG